MTRVALPRGDRIHIRHPMPEDREAFVAAARRSRRLHGPWVSAPDTPEAFDAYVRRSRRTNQACFLLRRNDDDAIVGVANLSEIVPGGLRSAFLGYYVFTPHARKGYLREGLDLVVEHGFRALGLHRVQASVRPRTPRRPSSCAPAGSVSRAPRPGTCTWTATGAITRSGCAWPTATPRPRSWPPRRP